MTVGIVGLACRLPGAATPEAFWELLSGAETAIGPAPPGRWPPVPIDPDGFEPGSIASDRGGFLADIARFDHERFGLGQAEAGALDPQQRLLWTVTAEALDDAALRPEAVAGSRTGVYVGIGYSEYATLSHRLGKAGAFASFNAPNVTVSRLAWAFDLRGPALGLDAGCASALVALGQALRDLRAGVVERAIVGAVSLLVTPDGTQALSAAGALSPTGRSRPFAADADGYVRGEGVVALVLEPVSSARPARALVASVAVGQRGRGPGGMLAPCAGAHAAVIAEAKGARAIGLVEAHAVGSAADRSEVSALAATLQAPALIGSCKARIGHLEWASGGASLAKAVLCLERGMAPPQPPVELPADWPAGLVCPERATPFDGAVLVDAFGLGGTDAAAVLTAAPRSPATERPAHLVVASAPTREAVQEARGAWVAALRADPSSVPELSATSVERARHAWVAVASGPAHTLADRLEGAAPSRVGPSPRVALAFTGQGSQRTGMGTALYASEPVFRLAVDRCAAVLDPLLAMPVVAAFGDDAVNHTSLAQPALFALGVGLLAVVRSWGLTPVAVVGHSLGEVIAAVAAGALTPEDGALLVARRAGLMGTLPEGGRMMAVNVDEATARAAIGALGGEVDLAAVNGPESVVLSGDGAAVEAVAAHLEEEAFAVARPLVTSHAFHSAAMDPVLDTFQAAAAAIPSANPRIPLGCNLTGGWHEGAPDAGYWRAHLRGAVRFADQARALDEVADVVLELGPAPVLTGLARGCAVRASWVPSGADPEALAAAAARLVELGAPLVRFGVRARHVPTPATPEAPTRAWLEVGEPPRPAAGLPAMLAAAASIVGGVVDPDRPLRDQGFDSLRMLALAERLRAGGQDVGLARIVASPSLRALVEPRPAPRPPTPHADGGAPVIAGLGLRVPGASTPDELWSLLASGATAIRPITRWPLGEADPPGARHAALLDDVESFEPEAFGLTEAAALAIDPAHRLLLEVTREALGAAGLGAGEVRGWRAGVYVGLIACDGERSADGSDAAAEIGRLRAGAAGRVAHALDWRGPAMTIDTACSSSLVALHLAVSALRRGEIDAALVAGAHLATSPEPFRYLARLGVLAPDGRCRPFDADASGYVRGEGACALLLVRPELAASLALPALAVVRGTAVGHGGHGNGYTTPSLDGQVDVIRAALADAGVEPRDVGYVEAHGTGTPLGDPIEGQALADAYGSVAVGSIKATIGHLEGASGVASLARVVLQLQRGERTPQAAFERRAPAWPAEVRPVVEAEPHLGLAAVHGVGMTGTLAHAVLGPAPATEGARAPVAVQFVRRRLRDEDDLERAIAQALGRPASPDRTLAEQGLDSVAAVALAARLGRSPRALGAARLRDLRSGLRVVRPGPAPLLWIHPGAGEEALQALAEAVGPRGLVVFEIPGEVLASGPSVDALARSVRAAAPCPAAVGGWSLGGIVAAAVGADAPLVIVDALLDPPEPDGAACEEGFVRSVAARLGIDPPPGLDGLDALGAGAYRAAFLPWREGYRRSIAAVRAFRWSPSRPWTVVLAEEGAAPHRAAWDALGASVVTVGGDHWSMWSGPRGEATARAVAAALGGSGHAVARDRETLGLRPADGAPPADRRSTSGH